MKPLSLILLSFAALFLLLIPASCIYMDAKTGCTSVEVNYAVTDSQGVSMAPSLDYHREGVGATNSNAAKQDGRLSAVGDAAFKAIADTAALISSGGASAAIPAAKILENQLGRKPSPEEIAALNAELAKLPKSDAAQLSH